jgi:hypothetical protein
MMCRGRYQRAKLITAQEMQLRGEARMQEVQTMAEAERKAMERALATAYQSAREDGVAFWEGELAALQTRLEQEVEERCASARSNAFFDPTPLLAVGIWPLGVTGWVRWTVDGGRVVTQGFRALEQRRGQGGAGTGAGACSASVGD